MPLDLGSPYFRQATVFFHLICAMVHLFFRSEFLGLRHQSFHIDYFLYRVKGLHLSPVRAR
jgi:hypothetical protein